MKKDFTQRIFEGEKIYPYLDGKIIKISIIYDLREHYKYIMKQSEIVSLLKENGYKEINNYIEFNRLLWEDITFLNIIKTYFKKIDKTLISDNHADKVYAINLVDKEERDYTLRLVESYCDMNRDHFFTDYIDVFGNKIEFK